ncbi:MAG TPA: peptide-methionine (S)-S-oxide reductase MsrA [Candidatus Paceibacterota bacterium]|nr:peptide-methionine (S)-S-oxide reductase MsrA [Candidatus Paceibacterota bacterium]
MNLDAQTSSGRNTGGTQMATLGGGCFWCLEALFKTLDGVIRVTSGYAGGNTVRPTYKQVCSGQTGHAEVIQIEFDPEIITYAELLEAFWQAHDPTTLNRQGPDVGTQYRSIILCHDEAQMKIAEQSRKKTAQRLKVPVVTQIVPLRQFYPAEDYHQDYFQLNPNVPYCAAVIRPKLEKFKKRSPLP